MALDDFVRLLMGELIWPRAGAHAVAQRLTEEALRAPPTWYERRLASRIQTAVDELGGPNVVYLGRTHDVIERSGARWELLALGRDRAAVVVFVAFDEIGRLAEDDGAATEFETAEVVDVGRE